MANANVSKQLLHVALVKDIRDQTVPFTEIEFLVHLRYDSSCVLASMLKNSKSVIQGLVHVRTKSPDDADNAAHMSPLVADSRAAFVFLPPNFA